MTKTALAVVLIVIALLIIAGGVYYYNNDNTTPIINIINPPPTTTNTGNTNTGQTRQASVPLVTTSSSVVRSDTTAVVTGSIVPNGAFTNYWYEYSTNADLSNKRSTASQTIGSSFVSIPAPAYITGLTKDTVYYFRLVGENALGRVAGNQASFQTTIGTPAPVGSAPKTTTIAASGISKNTANLNGSVTPNGATTQYWFEYGKTANLGDNSAFVSVGAGTQAVAAANSLTNLDPLTTYYFRLNAQNQFGTVNGAILNFKTTGPAAAIAPTITTRNATAIATSTATLNGAVNPNAVQTSYWFEYSTDANFSTAVKTTTHQSAGSGVTSTAIAASISGLSTKTTYYFRLVAESSVGTVRGEKVSFKTK